MNESTTDGTLGRLIDASYDSGYYSGKLQDGEPHHLAAIKEREYFRRAVLARMRNKEKCTWVEDSEGEYWNTSCNQAFTLLAGTPVENSIRFCPFCGDEVLQTVSAI